MVKTDGVKHKAQTYFEQISLDVVEKVLGRDAVRTHGGTGNGCEKNQAPQLGTFDRSLETSTRCGVSLGSPRQVDPR